MIIPLTRKLANEMEIRQFILIMLREIHTQFTIHADLDKLIISPSSTRSEVAELIRQITHMGLLDPIIALNEIQSFPTTYRRVS